MFFRWLWNSYVFHRGGDIGVGCDVVVGRGVVLMEHLRSADFSALRMRPENWSLMKRIHRMASGLLIGWGRLLGRCLSFGLS
jgi:hypothetical protein